MPPDLVLYITHHGYLAIFVLIFLQEIGVPNPVPNELVLMFSGYLTYRGILSIPLVILTAVTADFTGTNILYFVFFNFGAYILRHKPKWLPISQNSIEKMTTRVSKGGLWTIYLGRVTPFIRGYTSVTAGLLHLKPRVFLPIAFFSALTWASAYVIAGHFLGPSWQKVMEHNKNIKLILLFILAGIILIFTLISLIGRKLNKKKEGLESVPVQEGQ
ncbi:MAG: DedA family protein [Chitinophagaceae bacterium]